MGRTKEGLEEGLKKMKALREEFNKNLFIPGKKEGLNVELTFGYFCIFLGALLWWYGLTWLVDKVREKFSDNAIILINRIIGSIVVVFSFIMLIGTMFNLYTFSYW